MGGVGVTTTIPGGNPSNAPPNPYGTSQNTGYLPPGMDPSGVDKVPAVAMVPPVLSRIFRANMNPEQAFDRLINALIDNQMFFISLFSAPGSYQPNIDPFGLTYQRANVQGVTYGQAAETGGGGTVEGIPTRAMEMLAIDDPVVQNALTAAYAADEGLVVENLTAVQRQRIKDKIAIDTAGHNFVYVVGSPDSPAAVDDPATEIDETTRQLVGIMPTYDGTPFGNISHVGELLQGVPLDRPSLNNFMHNLAVTDVRRFRGLQSVMSMLGYYQEQDVTWGRAGMADRNAFLSMMQDLINEHLRTEEYNRRHPNAQIPDTEVTDFMDRKFAETIEQVQTDAGYRVTTDEYGNVSMVSPLDVLEGEVTEQVLDGLRKAWTGSGREVTPKVEAQISAAIAQLYAEGELEVDELMNTDLVGMPASDRMLAMADAFGAEYHGGDEDWVSQIRFGANGMPPELARMARGAGVELAGRHEDLYPPTSEQRQNIFRWYFLTLLNKNNGDLEMAANQYANTYGGSVYGQHNYDSSWLNGVVLRTTQPGSFGSRTSASTMEEQTRERIEALGTAEKRVLAAAGFGDIKNSTQQAAVTAVLNSFIPASRQRQSRL